MRRGLVNMVVDIYWVRHNICCCKKLFQSLGFDRPQPMFGLWDNNGTRGGP